MLRICNIYEVHYGKDIVAQNNNLIFLFVCFIFFLFQLGEGRVAGREDAVCVPEGSFWPVASCGPDSCHR